MPECQNCGSFVSESFADVVESTSSGAPISCPNCEDAEAMAELTA